MRAFSIGRIGAPALVFAAMLPAFPALAQQRNWRASSSADDGQAAFIDLNSIRRDGDRVRFLREVRMSAPMPLSDGTRIDRIGADMEIDCVARTLRNFELYASLGETQVLNDTINDQPQPIQAGTTADTDLRAVCRNEWPR